MEIILKGDLGMSNIHITKKSLIHWILGLLCNGLGICIGTKAGLGLSMIAATPYIISLWGGRFFSWLTQGKAEYVWEAILLILLCLVIRRFRWRYLLSFLTAVILGYVIDAWYLILGGNAVYVTMGGRVLGLVMGMLITSLGVAFFFRTDMPLEVYELAVIEITDRFGLEQSRVKWCFDMFLLLLDLLLAFIVSHSLCGIGIGTVIITLFNAPVISFIGKLIDKAEEKLF